MYQLCISSMLKENVTNLPICNFFSTDKIEDSIFLNQNVDKNNCQRSFRHWNTMYPSNGQWILYLLIPWWRSIRHKQTGLPFCLIGLLESLFNGKMYDSNWSPFFHENVQFFQFTIWFWRLWQISQINLILGKVFWFITWLVLCKSFIDMRSGQCNP